MIATAHPTHSSAAASAHAPASRSLELCEARQLRDALQTFLRREQAAMADFLVALADFDRRRCWERLGHAGLFVFWNVELGLSGGAAFVRSSAGRLIQAHPEALEPLRDGRLCLSSVAELGRVATPATFAELLPRFFGCSSREAREVAAAIAPRAAPPVRDQVTRLAPLDERCAAIPSPDPGVAPTATLPPGPLRPLAPNPAAVAAALTLAPLVDSESVRAHELDLTHPARVHARCDQVEPLTADLRRLRVTVSRQFLRDVETARTGLSHAIPNATTEQVLQEALRLLLEKQERTRGLVKRPRKPGAPPALAGTQTAAPIAASALTSAPASVPDSAAAATGTGASAPGASRAASGTGGETTNPAMNQAGREAANDARFEPRPHRREGRRESIPAAIRRAVWARDGACCSWPLDAGGRCGSTHRLELDHVVPWADWGGTTAANLRVVCRAHNRLAAREAFGERWMGRYTRQRA